MLEIDEIRKRLDELGMYISKSSDLSYEKTDYYIEAIVDAISTLGGYKIVLKKFRGDGIL